MQQTHAINDFMNIALKETNYETLDRNLFYKMPSDNELFYLDELKKNSTKIFSALNMSINLNLRKILVYYWGIICNL